MKDICEQYNACNVDEHSFKAYLNRWMAASTQMAPFTYNTSYPLLLSSAKAAAAQCTGSPSGSVCGLKWYLNGTWDGTNGVGQQMAALEVMLGTLIGTEVVKAPVTNTTGGTSLGNPSAGYNSSDVPPREIISPADKGDRIRAWFLTAVVSVAALWCWIFMSTDVLEGAGGVPTVGGKKASASRRWDEKGMGMGKWKRKGQELDVAEDEVGVEATPASSRQDVADERRSGQIYRGGTSPA